MEAVSTRARYTQLAKQWYLIYGTSRNSPPSLGSACAEAPTSHKANCTGVVCLSVRQQMVLAPAPHCLQEHNQLQDSSYQAELQGVGTKQITLREQAHRICRSAIVAKGKLRTLHSYMFKKKLLLLLQAVFRDYLIWGVSLSLDKYITWSVNRKPEVWAESNSDQHLWSLL